MSLIKALAGLAAVAVLGLAAFFWLGTEPSPENAVKSSAVRSSTVARRPTTITAMGQARERVMTDKLRAPLATPEAAVTSAVERLLAKKDDAFRETFLPAVRTELTTEVIERCRGHLSSTPVKPDWEAAELSTADGHPVRRVSMFGKSLTGFHQVADQWFADRVWCLPVGAP